MMETQTLTMGEFTDIEKKAINYSEAIKREPTYSLPEEDSGKINNKKGCHPENSDFCDREGKEKCPRNCFYSNEIRTILEEEFGPRTYASLMRN